MPTGRRKPDPDRILVARLSGTAVRLARAGGPIDDATAELRTLASGRGDLLAETAGVMAGSWSARVDTGDYLLAAACWCWLAPTTTSSAAGSRSGASGR